MKAAIINDTHFGARNDNQAFHNHFKKFFEGVFFPYLKKEKIKTIFHLGDVFDRRKYVNYVTLSVFRECFVEPIVKNGLHVEGIVGNHDTFYKTTNDVNSLVELNWNQHDNINFYWQPTEVEFDGNKILMVPWINAANRELSMELLDKSDARYAFGHFELNGFEVNGGFVCNQGMEETAFGDYDVILSGHFHKKQSKGNIHYLGAPYQMNWGDYNQPKGFHILDFETNELEFIPNPLRMFHKVMYDDEDKELQEVLNVNLAHCENSYIKIIIRNKTNPHSFDLFMDKLYENNPAHVAVIEDHHNFDVISDDDLVDQAEDTLTIMKKYVKNLNIKGIEEDDLQGLLADLYQEAIALDTE